MSDGSKSFEEEKSLYFLSAATFIGRWGGEGEDTETLHLVMLLHCFISSQTSVQMSFYLHTLC